MDAEKEMESMINQGPTLTFGETPEPAAPAVPVMVQEDPQKLALSVQEQKMVEDFAASIDLKNTQAILQYGAGSQKKIADFSESALANVRTKDLGEVGAMLADVVGELKDFEAPEESKGLFGLFKKSGNALSSLQAKYGKAEANVNRITKVLEGHQVALLKDVAMLDKMYELNLQHHKELTMYILAGKEKIAKTRSEDLPVLERQAQESGLPEDAQKVRDMTEMCSRFEKKIYDLELTRTIALQMAPQIRMLQSNDTAMADKIQSTLLNTIPLWKSQMMIAIGLNHSVSAAQAQRAVSDMTNAMLKKNAESLRMATLETAKESERGIVDLETLQATNQSLISTLDEVALIQEEGRQKRLAAEKELQLIENQMKDKLLEMSRRQNRP